MKALRRIVEKKRYALVTMEGTMRGPEPVKIDPKLPDWLKDRFKGSSKRYGHLDSLEIMIEVTKVVEAKDVDDGLVPKAAASLSDLACYDYLPFGEELGQGLDGRRANGCYPASVVFPQPTDATSLKFTGKERDAETGLDYFGARYFSAAQGRFTSPDWSAKPVPVPYAVLNDPQTLNLYGYVRNNPLSHVDPDGHFDCSGKNAQLVGCQYIATWNSEHGVSPTAKKSDAAGVPVKLPNGGTVADKNSPSGLLMSPTSDLSGVAARGKAIKFEMDNAMRFRNPLGAGTAEAIAALGILEKGLKAAVRQNGDFDYQRTTVEGALQQLPQFRDVSNFNVGLLGQQAGLSLNDILTIAGSYARLNSSNYRGDQPYGLDPRTREFTEVGFKAGASGVYDH